MNWPTTNKAVHGRYVLQAAVSYMHPRASNELPETT